VRALNIRRIVIGSVLLVLLFWFRPLTVVPAGSCAVLDTFGKVAEHELTSGLRPKWILAKPHKMNVRTQEYTMSIAPKEGEREGNDSIDIRTSERVKLALDITVFFHLMVDRADEVYRELGPDYVEDIIRPAIRTAIRDMSVLYDTKQICSDTRVEFVQKIEERLRALVESRGVEIEEVLLRNVGLPEELDKSIVAKLQKQQEAEAMPFVLQTARQESTRKVIEAGGIKAAQEIIAQKLTPAYLRWYSIEMMKGLAESPNTTFLFVPVDESGMPIINIMTK